MTTPAEDLMNEFGKWRIWRGVADGDGQRWWYAQTCKASPPVTLRAEDLAGLREELVKQARP